MVQAMGKTLAALFKEAEELGGFRGKLMLARACETPTALVDVLPDTQTRLDLATAALERLREHPISAEPSPIDADVLDAPGPYAGVSLALMSSRRAWIGDLDKAARKICEAAAEILQIERAGVWLLDDSADAIRCVSTYIRSNSEWGGTSGPTSTRCAARRSSMLTRHAPTLARPASPRSISSRWASSP